VTEALQRFTVLGKCRFGFIAQAHQGFFAALFLSTDEDIVDFCRRHRPGVGIVGILPESAIAASVPAEIRYRKEDLSRVSDCFSFSFIAQSSGLLNKRFESRASGVNQLISFPD